MITIDTNIFIYAADARPSPKRQTAADTIRGVRRLDGPIGLQVVGEFQRAARRKVPLASTDLIEQGRWMLASFSLFAATPTAVLRAIERHDAAKLSYWDALLITSAAEAGCRTLLSEDMGDGESYFGVHVVNPFDVAGGLSDPARELLDL